MLHDIMANPHFKRPWYNPQRKRFAKVSHIFNFQAFHSLHVPWNCYRIVVRTVSVARVPGKSLDFFFFNSLEFIRFFWVLQCWGESKCLASDVKRLTLRLNQDFDTNSSPIDGIPYKLSYNSKLCSVSSAKNIFGFTCFFELIQVVALPDEKMATRT